MAMVVKNNMSAISTLNTLNKNSAGLSKSLAKVSSGQRVNGAADDASGYAISERMRVQVRALDQDNRNTQSGTSMMKVAEGAVSSTVDILKTLKEKVVSAANDDKTDSDRAAIQKELDQSIDQINDNANVTFNGKYLVDGSHNNAVKAGGVANTMTNESLHKTTNSKTTFADMKDRNGNSLNIQETDKITISFVKEGKTYEASVAGSNNFEELLNAANSTNGEVKGKALNSGDYVQGPMDSGVYGTNGLVVGGANSQIVDKETFAAAVNGAFSVGSTAADAAKGGAITAASNATKATVYFAFDGNSAQTASASVTFNSNTGTDNVSISISDIELGSDGALSFKAKATDEVDGERGAAAGAFATIADTKLASYINDSGLGGDDKGNFSHVMAATGTDLTALKWTHDKSASDSTNIYDGANSVFNVHTELGTGTTYEFPTNDNPQVGTSDYIGTNRSGLNEYTADRGNAITFTSADHGTKGQVAGVTIKVEDQYGVINKSANAVLDNFTESIAAQDQSSDNAIVLQVGTKANQAIKVGLMDMRAEALGLRASNGDNIQIGTQKQANVAINVLDNAISKALDQQTTIGSVESRLEYTSQNLTTASENVQASESTIRDADMAKEMTEYTKNNVLFQAAQSMLAQANQNSSAVLSLLQ